MKVYRIDFYDSNEDALRGFVQIARCAPYSLMLNRRTGVVVAGCRRFDSTKEAYEHWHRRCRSSAIVVASRARLFCDALLKQGVRPGLNDLALADAAEAIAHVMLMRGATPAAALSKCLDECVSDVMFESDVPLGAFPRRFAQFIEVSTWWGSLYALQKWASQRYQTNENVANELLNFADYLRTSIASLSLNGPTRSQVVRSQPTEQRTDK